MTSQVVVLWHIQGEASPTYFILNGFLAVAPSYQSDSIALLIFEVVSIGGLYFRIVMLANYGKHHKMFSIKK